ncbi:MAG TPA: molybdopterin-dependent oxidoreductase, partial [Gemmatimonadales bacterium]|nr:molybdopterin-dependent oxidoreductase [Gemmatimonadales bacterium]
VVVRLRPRPNLEVNRHFMCDHGRMNYRWMNRGDRIEAPLVRDGARHVATDWDAALDRFGEILRGTRGSAVILASGRASTESLGLIRRLVEGRDVTAAVQVPVGDEAPLTGIPSLALRRDRAPNVAGAELLGYGRDWAGAMAAVANAAVVIVLDAELSPDDQALLARAPGLLVLLGTVPYEGIRNATLVLPVTSMAEENGTYVNRDLRAQRYNQARSQPGMARPAWWVAGEVLAGPGPDADAPATAAQAFAMLGATWDVFTGLTYADLGFTGHVLKPNAPAGAAR